MQEFINRTRQVKKMHSFCIEVHKGLAYHLEGLRVPQFGNHYYKLCIMFILLIFFVGFASIFILTAQFGTVIVQSFVRTHGESTIQYL